MRIKAVLLDFGGTLADGTLDRESYHETIRNFLISHGFNITRKDIRKALRSSLMKLEKVRAKGHEMAFEEMYSIFLRNLGIKYNDNILDELHNIYRNHYKTHFLPCTELVLEELSTKYKIALVSNTISNQPKRLLIEAGLDRFFNVMYCSSELGIRKPNPQIFKMVLNKLGVEPYEAVHVGDNVQADMWGAKKVGITGIWIKNPNQDPWQGYTINNICELPIFLEKIVEKENS